MTEKYRKLPLVTEFQYNSIIRLFENNEMRLLRECENTKDDKIHEVLENQRVFIAWFMHNSKQVEI